MEYMFLFMAYRHVYVLVYGLRFFFQRIKMSKALYTGKVAKFFFFVYSIYAFLWHMGTRMFIRFTARAVHSVYRECLL